MKAKLGFLLFVLSMFSNPVFSENNSDEHWEVFKYRNFIVTLPGNIDHDKIEPLKSEGRVVGSFKDGGLKFYWYGKSGFRHHRPTDSNEAILDRIEKGYTNLETAVKPVTLSNVPVIWREGIFKDSKNKTRNVVMIEYESKGLPCLILIEYLKGDMEIEKMAQKVIASLVIPEESIYARVARSGPGKFLFGIVTIPLWPLLVGNLYVLGLFLVIFWGSSFVFFKLSFEPSGPTPKQTLLFFVIWWFVLWLIGTQFVGLTVG